jgi:CelD/BcsL family acetyltransferase involved in cellulose biosynthesis
LTAPGDIVQAVHARVVPDFAEAALPGLYGNIFSTLALFRAYGWRPGTTHTYVARRGGAYEDILLYDLEGGVARVKNEGITLDAPRLERFARHLFARHAGLRAIVLRAVEADTRGLALPCQRHRFSEDFVVGLPEARSAYDDRLGKKTRANLRYYGNKLARDFPGYRFEIREGAAIDAGVVRALIGFKLIRLGQKGVRSLFDAAEIDATLAIAREHGLLGLIWLGDELVAGAMVYRAGAGYSLNFQAYDTRYDAYRLGLLCCYQTILACIDRGGGQFHFLWGRSEHKYRLGARPRDIDNLVVYRSSWAAMRSPRLLIGALVEGLRRDAKFWLSYSEDTLPRLARRARDRLRGAPD